MMVSTLILALVVGTGVGLVLRKRKAKKAAAALSAKAEVENARSIEVATKTRALLEELHRKPGSTLVIEDPEEILSLIDQQQKLQQASEEMDRRATVPANYLMVH